MSEQERNQDRAELEARIFAGQVIGRARDRLSLAEIKQMRDRTPDLIQELQEIFLNMRVG